MLTPSEVQTAANYVRSRIGCFEAKIGIVTGTGLKHLGNLVRNPVSVSFNDIPHFPKQTAINHGAEFLFGELRGCNVALMTGRYHLYEGVEPSRAVIAIRVMKLLGIETVILTNAAGGVNPQYNIGDIMVVEDHINLAGMAGLNSLLGPNSKEFGVRFPALSKCYDAELRGVVYRAAKDLKLSRWMRNGVYFCQSGPAFETPAEVSMVWRLGGDAAGMSTAYETTVACQCGMRVLALSLICNRCIHRGTKEDIPPPTDEEVDIPALSPPEQASP